MELERKVENVLRRSETNESAVLLPEYVRTVSFRSSRICYITQLKLRWVLVFVMFLLNTANGWGWLAHSAVIMEAKNFYEVKESLISILPLLYFLMTFLLILPATYFINNNGLRKTIIIAAFIQVIGAILNIIASALVIRKHSYYLLVTGQFFYACSSPFITALPTKLSNCCFEERERPLANNIGSLGNLMGVMLANVLVPQIVSRIGFSYIVEIISASPAILGMLLCFVFYMNDELKHPVNSHVNFTKDLLMLVRIKKFTLLSIFFGITIGGFGSLLAMFVPIAKYQHYDTSLYGIALAVMILVGIISSSFICYMTGRYSCSILYMKIAQPTIAVMLCFMCIMTQYKINYFVFLLGLCSFSSISVALLPLYLVTGVNITRPLPAGLCAGILLLSGQSFSFVISIIMTTILNYHPTIRGPAFALLALIVPMSISSISFIICFKKNPYD